MTADARFTRQSRLAEVGDAGQARLEAATARVTAGDAIEARYLRGAGVRVTVVEASEVAPEEIPAWIVFLSPAARDVASGAYSALEIIRGVLAGSPHPRVQQGSTTLAREHGT